MLWISDLFERCDNEELRMMGSKSLYRFISCNIDKQEKVRRPSASNDDNCCGVDLLRATMLRLMCMALG